MNELFFGLSASTWRAPAPSALFFDELIEFLCNHLKEDLRDVFINNVVVPLESLCRRKYDQLNKPESQEVEREFRFCIHQEILEAARPALQWYLQEAPGEGMYRTTAEDLIEALDRATALKCDVIIQGE